MTHKEIDRIADTKILYGHSIFGDIQNVEHADVALHQETPDGISDAEHNSSIENSNQEEQTENDSRHSRSKICILNTKHQAHANKVFEIFYIQNRNTLYQSTSNTEPTENEFYTNILYY